MKIKELIDLLQNLEHQDYSVSVPALDNHILPDVKVWEVPRRYPDEDVSWDRAHYILHGYDPDDDEP